MSTKNMVLNRDLHKQAKVRSLVLKGLSNSEIASLLKIKISTVKWHVSKILKANNTGSRTKLIYKHLTREQF